jgi:hypothetical protein
MRLSQFQNLMTDEFGQAYAQVISKDQVLGALGDRTADAALAAGEDPREVWLALCEANNVPKERWAGKPQAKNAKSSGPKGHI